MFFARFLVLIVLTAVLAAEERKQATPKAVREGFVERSATAECIVLFEVSAEHGTVVLDLIQGDPEEQKWIKSVVLPPSGDRESRKELAVVFDGSPHDLTSMQIEDDSILLGRDGRGNMVFYSIENFVADLEEFRRKSKTKEEVDGSK